LNGDLQIEEVISRSGVTAMLISGDIDLQGRDKLREAIQRVCGQAASDVIVDLSGVAFMDATGLNALIEAQRLCDRSGVELLVTGASTPARRLFRIVGADRTLSIL
jgi:anti-sigma B factor antagonist